MTREHATSTRLLDEQGFTLIELLVSILSATVVAGALFAVLSFSTTETSTLADKVSSDQLGRIAMTRIVDELHSACISPGFEPIQIESNESALIFRNAYSESAEIASGAEHVIEWTKKTLIEKNYASTGGTYPNFTYTTRAKPTSEVVIAKNVTQNLNKSGEVVPIFQYFSYNKETTESASEAVNTISPTPLKGANLKAGEKGLNEEEASEAASVEISFNAASSSGNTTFNRSFNLSNQVTFAFSVPNAETPIHDAPCQ